MYIGLNRPQIAKIILEMDFFTIKFRKEILHIRASIPKVHFPIWPMAAILEISLKKYPPDGPFFLGVKRHPKGIESKGFIYVPICGKAEVLCDYMYMLYGTMPSCGRASAEFPTLYTICPLFTRDISDHVMYDDVVLSH